MGYALAPPIGFDRILAIWIAGLTTIQKKGEYAHE
jgi:hypothetical protein